MRMFAESSAKLDIFFQDGFISSMAKRAYLILSLTGLTASLLVGACGRGASANSAASSNRQPFYLISGVDTSASARTQLPEFVKVIKNLGPEMDCPGDMLTVFRIDNESREIFGPRPPLSGRRFMENLVVAAKPGASAPGTYHVAFMERAMLLASTSKLPVVILLLTDGQNDDLSESAIKKMQILASQLGKMSQVKAVIWGGVRTGWRERIRFEMQKALGDRLRFENLEDLEIGMVRP
jgi:hypothetical protein